MNMMMHKGCGCFCHKFRWVMGWLTIIAGILFFVAAFNSTAMLWGYGAGFFFEAAIVIAVMAHGSKGCRCCMGHGEGYKCEDCKMDGMKDKEPMM